MKLLLWSQWYDFNLSCKSWLSLLFGTQKDIMALKDELYHFIILFSAYLTIDGEQHDGLVASGGGMTMGSAGLTYLMPER